MRKIIILSLVLTIFTLPAIKTRAVQPTIGCDINTPCSNGLECIEFPEKGPLCADPDPCSYYECPEGKKCIIQESYPLKVICSENEVIPDEEEITAEDLETKEPTLLPNSRFYFLKEFSRSVRSFFTFNPVKKAGLKLKYANEKIIELKKLAKEEQDSSILEKSIKKYEEEINEIKSASEKIEEKASENEEVGKFLEKFTNQQLLHQIILKKLEEQVPENVFQKIEQIRERHLERFGEVIGKLENRERIQERLEKHIENTRGSEIKKLKNIEILKELEEKVPEQARNSIKAARENSLNKINDNIQNLPEVEAGRIRRYINNLAPENEEETVCIQLWDPVCGKNGETYSNSCFARKAGIEIEYKGECKNNDSTLIPNERSLKNPETTNKLESL